MSDSEDKLVQLVAAEVVKVLAERGALPASGGGSPRADVRPPIGQCTGDYSKFPELAGRVGGANSAPATATPLTGIITANQLQEAIDKSADGVATIAQDARFTPLANDLARQHPDRVRRGSAQAAQPTSNARWLWWMDGQCPIATQIVQQRAHAMRPATGGSLTHVVRDSVAAVKSRQALGAVLFVPNAARAMCYANRPSSLRAVVGTCGEAVEQGIAALGANVLVIEYPYVKPDAMTAMVDRFISQTPQASPQVQRDLADMQRSG